MADMKPFLRDYKAEKDAWADLLLLIFPNEFDNHSWKITAYNMHFD